MSEGGGALFASPETPLPLSPGRSFFFFFSLAPHLEQLSAFPSTARKVSKICFLFAFLSHFYFIFLSGTTMNFRRSQTCPLEQKRVKSQSIYCPPSPPRHAHTSTYYRLNTLNLIRLSRKSAYYTSYGLGKSTKGRHRDQVLSPVVLPSHISTHFLF